MAMNARLDAQSLSELEMKNKIHRELRALVKEYQGSTSLSTHSISFVSLKS